MSFPALLAQAATPCANPVALLLVRAASGILREMSEVTLILSAVERGDLHAA
ncbi:MAG: hypothetical protein JWO38_6609, partial [Gemmataceae bacterium]|nr:hypothetical protein [Gemmataceae bacterium]